MASRCIAVVHTVFATGETEMFERSSHLYDALYDFKEYGRESQQLHELIQRHKRSSGNDLLDVACGTGRHLEHLQGPYRVQGLDLDVKFLALARQRNPKVTFHQGDMLDFDLGRLFDVVTCLFSSIGYVRTPPRLDQAIVTMAAHLKPGGLLVVEPWLTPEDYEVGSVHAHFVDQPGLKIARMNVSAEEEGISVLDMHYLVATAQGVEHFVERHELGLFSHQQYIEALTKAGLERVYDPEGLMGRGLYLGLKPEARGARG